MSFAVKIELSPESEHLIAWLSQEAPAQLTAGLMRTLDKQNQQTVGYIDEKKLRQRGPETLGVISSRLWKSIRNTPAVAGSDGGITSSIGSNVVYAGVHEFGFDGMVTVRSHSRKITEFARGAKQVKVFYMKDGRIRARDVRTKRRETGGTVQVREFERHMHMPERAYIRRSLEERAPEYMTAIEGTLTTLFNKAS